MWRLALGGALLILFGSVMFFVIGGLLLGASLNEAIFVGACVSLSSTAVVVKCIKLEELEHLYGLLVMQDVLLGLMLVSRMGISGFKWSRTFLWPLEYISIIFNPTFACFFHRHDRRSYQRWQSPA